MFTRLVSLWYLVFQRLNPDHTLAAVVVDALGGGADALEPGDRRPLSQRIESSGTTSYSDARQRLPLSIVKEAFHLGTPHLASATCEPLLTGMQLIDGTWLAMPALPALAREYPPASNQHGSSPWSQMRALAAFDAQSGGVLAAVEAAISTSEQALCGELLGQCPEGTLSIGDRNFGVFRVVQAARKHRQQVLLRLTETRAKRLLRANGGRLDGLASRQEWSVHWAPTRHDQQEPGAETTPVPGRLLLVHLQRPGRRAIRLWLFTTLVDAERFGLETLVRWYGLRWRAELGFRYLKSQLDLNLFFAFSPDMVRKEFYAALLAFNLVRSTMAKLAETMALPIEEVSFQAARRALLQAWELWSRDWKAKPGLGAGFRLPKRRKPRPNEPRAVRYHPRIFPKLVGSRAEARARLAAASALS